MKVFYFSDRGVSEAKRDENGVLELTPEGKTIADDYLSIIVKVPKRECNVDFRQVVRWQAMDLRMPWEVGAAGAEFSRLELYKGCVSILEGMVRDIHEKIRDEEKEASGEPGESGAPEEAPETL